MNLSTAIEFATAALAEKTDDKGSPYINHALRVMEKMDTEEEKMAAVLHDVVEDTEITLQDLCVAGFSSEKNVVPDIFNGKARRNGSGNSAG